jgi:ADP-ribosylglycohydrolase
MTSIANLFLTPRCGRALEYADTLRRARPNTALSGIYLVAGLLSLGNGVAVNLLKSYGVTLGAVEDHLASIPSTESESVPAATPSSIPAFAAPALARAHKEARLCDHTYTGTEHLLLALLAEENNSTAEFFQIAKIDRRAATSAILREYRFRTPSDPNPLLLLEDNLDRCAAFHAAASSLPQPLEIRLWHDAARMLAEIPEHLDSARLISLDDDLNPQPGAASDPGCGREVSQLLAGYLPLAPVIIHSTNADAAWSMYNDLRFAGWPVERVGPIGEDWIAKLWLPKARELLRAYSFPSPFRRKPDHEESLGFALDSLEGLAIGDALGEMLSYRHREAVQIMNGTLPPAPWRRTDDSEMALSIVEVLKMYGYIHEDALARRFAWRFECDPERGYGKMTRIQLTEVSRGADWRKTAAAAFDGLGSMGNGAAMRVAPVGAFFWNRAERILEEARRPAVVTHTHPEGIAGAIAVAVAAAEAVRIRKEGSESPARQILGAAHDETPNGKVREGLERALQIPAGANIHEVAKLLGNGSLVTAPDTVPYDIWCAAHHLDNYPQGVLTAVSGGGDCDTNAAITGGIIASFTGREGIPDSWRHSKERFPAHVA